MQEGVLFLRPPPYAFYIFEMIMHPKPDSSSLETKRKELNQKLDRTPIWFGR